MGTTLTGTTPQDTYDSLIKVTDNGPLSGSLKVLTDGLGNNSAISLSTSAASVTGTLEVSSTGVFVGDLRTNGNFSVGNTTLVGTKVAQIYPSATSTPAIIQGVHAGVGPYDLALQTSGGNVGIGTTAPASILAVSAASPTITLTATTTTATTIGNKNNRLLLLADSTTVGNGGEVVFGTGDTSTSRWAAISANITTNSGTGAAGSIIFATKAAAVDTSLTERVRILADGGLTFNGDTAQANALDDYEEGTWTMGVSFGGASVGMTFVNNQGRYTKIGRQVTAGGYMAFANKGSSTGDATLTGLPFTSGAFAAGITPVTLRLENITFTNAFQGFLDTSRTSIDLGEVTILGVTSTLTNADFSNNSVIMVSVTYTV